jgi:hypothetical protein
MGIDDGFERESLSLWEWYIFYWVIVFGAQ